MPECITFKPVHSAEYPYSVGIRFDRNSPVHEHIDHYNRLAAWCEEHLEPGSWTIAIFTHGIHFKTEADLLMFKLRWC